MHSLAFQRIAPAILVALALAALALAQAPNLLAQAPTQAPPYVELVGRAVLPADTFAPGPPTGAFISPTQNTNGRTPPFASHPVQGISAIIPLHGGSWLALSDNGFGGKNNSPDYRLRWYELRPDFAAGTVTVGGFSELHDPDGLVPWPIVNGDTDRVLTGGDFDPESFRQAPDGTIWVGEEFGPYLLHVDVTGKLLAPPIPTPFPAELQPFARGLPFVQSPEHPDFVSQPDNNARRALANLPSSRGFEGMALNSSGTRLFLLLEGALVDDPEPTRLLVSEFDLAAQRYSGRYWFYPLSDPRHAIGEMTALNDQQFLVIERDAEQGELASFKRIFLVDLREKDERQFLRKTLVADLMQIGDPRGLTEAEEGAIGLGPVFKFPFVTIESVYPLGRKTLLVVNDNNYPFSDGRRPGRAPDDTEFILISLAEPLGLP
jgi:glycerophosphoryl diester phosphodiesterase